MSSSTSHRKLLVFSEPPGGDDSPCSDSPPNTPAALLPPPHRLHPMHNTPITTSLLPLAVVASFLLGLCLVSTIRCYCFRRNARGSSTPVLFRMSVNHPLPDDDQGLEDHRHPIWMINTVGLDRSDIDSIAVCEFKKGDGLIDGTECTICLGEFEEGDKLRLLPNCSHAFHVPCVDTWLRSHKNCPLCRAPIVRDVAIPCSRVNLEEPWLNKGKTECSSTTVSDGADRCTSEGGGSRGKNEERKEKGARPCVMEIRRTMAVDNRGRFTKEARRARDAVHASKNGESSHYKIKRSASDAGILSVEKTSRKTPSHLF